MREDGFTRFGSIYADGVSTHQTKTTVHITSHYSSSNNLRIHQRDVSSSAVEQTGPGAVPPTRGPKCPAAGSLCAAHAKIQTANGTPDIAGQRLGANDPSLMPPTPCHVICGEMCPGLVDNRALPVRPCPVPHTLHQDRHQGRL